MVFSDVLHLIMNNQNVRSPSFFQQFLATQLPSHRQQLVLKAANYPLSLYLFVSCIDWFVMLQNLSDVPNLVPAPLETTALTCVGHQFTLKHHSFSGFVWWFWKDPKQTPQADYRESKHSCWSWDPSSKYTVSTLTRWSTVFRTFLFTMWGEKRENKRERGE